MKATARLLGPRFDEALLLATKLHAGQVRKGGDIPYIAHLLAVAALVLESGGDEDEAIAALLHDSVEDQGGAPTLAEVRRLFGDRVAAVVEGCSDTDQVPKPPWRSRKETYLAHLQTATPEVLRVSLADKLHNARAVMSDLGLHGDGLWSRFNAGKSEQLWYYRGLADAFLKVRPGQMADELDRVVTAIEKLASEPAGNATSS